MVTSASATAMAPQAFNFALHFLLFKAKKNREEAEVEAEQEEMNETHCTTL